MNFLNKTIEITPSPTANVAGIADLNPDGLTFMPSSITITPSGVADGESITVTPMFTGSTAAVGDGWTFTDDTPQNQAYAFVCGWSKITFVAVSNIADSAAEFQITVVGIQE
jgi:hypothetical protein